MAMIACKDCDHRISDQAAGCPNCGAPIGASTAVFTRGQRTTIGTLVAVAALGLIGATFWAKTSRLPGGPGVSAQAPSEPASVEFKAAPSEPAPAALKAAPSDPAPAAVKAAPRAVYKTTAERLYQDYLANGVATQSKIANGLVRVSGKVAAIDEDAAGNPVVKLAASNDASVDMTLGADEVAAAAQLTRGQTVDIECDRMRRIMGSPEGSQCSLALVEGASAAPSLATREPVAVAVAPVAQMHAVASGRKSHKASSAPVSVALVPAAAPAPSAGADPAASPDAAAPLVAVPPLVAATSPAAAAPAVAAASLTAAAPAVAATPLAAATPAAAATSPVAAAPPAAAEQAAATPPAMVPVALAATGLDTSAVSATSAAATPVRLTQATEASASAQDASLSTAPSTAAAVSDDLSTVRASDPQAAERITSYCANSASGGSGTATCRRDEKDAWTRLVLHNEFPALDDATRQKCNQPPFPDSYRAKEICAKYELRVY